MSELHAIRHGCRGLGALCPPAAVLASPGWHCTSQTQSAPLPFTATLNVRHEASTRPRGADSARTLQESSCLPALAATPQQKPRQGTESLEISLYSGSFSCASKEASCFLQAVLPRRVPGRVFCSAQMRGGEGKASGPQEAPTEQENERLLVRRPRSASCPAGYLMSTVATPRGS